MLGLEHEVGEHWLTFAEAKAELLRVLREEPHAELISIENSVYLYAQITGRFGSITVEFVLSAYGWEDDVDSRALVGFYIPEYPLESVLTEPPITLAVFREVLLHLHEIRFVYYPTFAGGVLISHRLVGSFAGVEVLHDVRRVAGKRAAAARMRHPWETYVLPVPIGTKHGVMCACRRCARRICAGPAESVVSASEGLAREWANRHAIVLQETSAQICDPEVADEQWPSFTTAKAEILRMLSEHPRACIGSSKQEESVFTLEGAIENVAFWFRLSVAGEEPGAEAGADGQVEIEYRVGPSDWVRDTITQGNPEWMTFRAFCDLLWSVNEMELLYYPTYAGETLLRARVVATRGDQTLVLFDRHHSPDPVPDEAELPPAETYRIPMLNYSGHLVGCACRRCARMIRKHYPDLRLP